MRIIEMIRPFHVPPLYAVKPAEPPSPHLDYWQAKQSPKEPKNETEVNILC